VAGYVALMINGKTPYSWGAAVEDFGVFDWFATIEHAEPALKEYSDEGRD
jgi:hypothetical protein